MISKNQIKFIRSLELRKNRRQSGLFIAEGPKVVGDLMKRQLPAWVVATPEWLQAEWAPVAGNRKDTGEVQVMEVTEEELKRVSCLQHPQKVLALFALPDAGDEWNRDGLIGDDRLLLALDGVQDPGNMGTIIRIADWFGIDTILCSPDTADAFNPKVVQATMGSIARVRLIYTDLVAFCRTLPADYPVYGTLLDGSDIYRQPLTAHGIIVMGNEGKGISPALRQLVNRRLLIPQFGGAVGAESLNVAIATAITCSEFRRRQ
ncbi:MAG: RNA methyltransferase [Prevotella sp.]